MNEYAANVLKLGGVPVEDFASTDETAMATLESWLGLPSARDWEYDHDMMEECVPFASPETLYQTLEKFLIHMWDPETITETMLHSNELLELHDVPPQEMSLYKAMESVRVTRLLRYWMELNVQGGTGPEESNSTPKSLSHLLLEGAQWDEEAKLYPLVRALYHHVEELPQLQSQMNFYTQSLLREIRLSTAGRPLENPGSRLQKYQETQEIASKLNQEWDEHVGSLEDILAEWYALGSTNIRRQCRSHMGSVWSHFVVRSGGGGGVTMENTSSSGVQITLPILHRILQGTSLRNRLEKSHEHLLTYHLIPLHEPNAMVLWRDQSSLLELYHEPLVQCIAILLQQQPKWIPRTIAALLEPDVWSKGGNTPKLVLLLHEIDTYLGILPQDIDMPSNYLSKFLTTLGSCMASDHSRLAERALTFIKNKRFQLLLEQHFEHSLAILLPFLVRTEPAWNPTVRKMTYNVLHTLKESDEERFLAMCDKIFPSEHYHQPSDREKMEMPPPRRGTVKRASQQTASKPPKDFTLKSAMGSWRPPNASAGPTGALRPPSNNKSLPSRSDDRAPPLAVTGVAPWAMSRPPSNSISRGGSTKFPPLGVTGVAPWAMKERPTPSVKRPLPGVIGQIDAESDLTEAEDHKRSRVLTYMDTIKPPELVQGASSWSIQQMEETPTLLPNLKFHDLVFGHDLGEGAFGSVRYARLIDRDTTRSKWPEFAVKIISTKKIRELGYEASVQRELAVLRLLSHPGIARMVSSFRFREGVYLVLEYASGGDLHTLLKKNGSLDHESTRFVIGEIVAALSSIHELGLVYGDLKPENIVITESGHVKITDFGGCRPVTSSARKLVTEAATNLLRDLRNGDWKQLQPNKQNPSLETGEPGIGRQPRDADDAIVLDDDNRIEGTTAYLPPEVVLGGFPTPAADSWALGCVLYQCLSGRPPILEADDTQTKHRIVSFDADDSQEGDEGTLFGVTHGAGIQLNARDLIKNLLDRDVEGRLGIGQVPSHAFFTSVGIDVFSLYRDVAPPLDVGEVAPVAEAKWSRRQFSSIWAPQPQAYDISLSKDSKRPNSRKSSGPIEEGDECTAFFSKASRVGDSRLAGIAEKALQIPRPGQGKSSLARLH